MAAWMFDLFLTALAVLVLGFVFFKLMFSSSEEARRELALRPKPRLERREAERKDRRRRTAESPTGAERRVGARR